MNIADPRIDPKLVPEGSRPIIKGVGQEQLYQPLPSVQTPDGRVISRWRPTPDERRRIMDGEDLYLTVHTFGAKLQPQLLTVGPIDWTQQ